MEVLKEGGGGGGGRGRFVEEGRMGEGARNSQQVPIPGGGE